MHLKQKVGIQKRFDTQPSSQKNIYVSRNNESINIARNELENNKSNSYKLSKFEKYDINLKSKEKKKRELIRKLIKRFERGHHRILKKWQRQKIHRKQQNEGQKFDDEQIQEYQQSQIQVQIEQIDQGLDKISSEKVKLSTSQKINLQFLNHSIQQSSLKLTQKKKHYLQFLQKVPSNQMKTFILKRKSSLLNKFLPSFQFFEQQNEQQKIYCQKVSPLTFVFSCSNINIETPQFCLGKLVSNFTGSELNFFSFNYQKQQGIKMINEMQIQYTNSLLLFLKPRSLKVYIQSQHVQKNVQHQKRKKLLRQLYEQHNDIRILLFKSRQPKYNRQLKQYELNFQGNAGMHSVKNFILQSENENERNYLLFAKSKQNQYKVKIAHPFTPLFAFAVCVSQFNGKILCQ